MDTFIARFAFKHQELGISSTWVLPLIEDPQPDKAKIAAYYTLSSGTVTREEIPFGKSLPAYPLPVVLLAKLAVDNKFQRSKDRIGEKTLITALRKSVELTDAGLSALGLILDVLDEEAIVFYQRYEMFEAFSDDPMHLFVSMNTLRHV